MATIRAVCNSCNAQVDLRPAEIAAHVPDGSRPETHEGSYAFRCSACRTFVVKPADDRVIGLLVAGGVEISSSDDAPWSHLRHPEAPLPDGPALTLDDLIDFHELLETDDWFATLIDGDHGGWAEAA
ncbi:MAG: hypothetical protein KY469_20810 [Actinobacteria bacterium]|nr:hypothetical protein [Actinomycetota bacterium]